MSSHGGWSAGNGARSIHDDLGQELNSLDTLLSMDEEWKSQASVGTQAQARGRANMTNHSHGSSQYTEADDDDNTILNQELHSLETLLTMDKELTDNSAKAMSSLKPKPQEHSRDPGMKVKNLAGMNGDAKPAPHVRGTGLEFEELTYTVVKKQKKDGKWIKREVDLLHGIRGFAAKGQVTAVMGPSGAGKSTFLDALAGRIASGSLGGITTVDGKPVTPSLMKRMSAYVMQDDQLFPMLTVWETLWFAAEVRLDPKMSHGEKRDRVIKLIEQLGLTNAQNTYIGDDGTRGISGGEKRRVSIGVDIIHGPALLFLDEPTSGLDSTSAFSVIERVHDIANAGSTVILTIHQPSSRIVQLLNRLIILARGQLIYSGSPSYLSTHLAAFGREVPRGENSIEYLLDVIQEFEGSTLGLEPLVQFNIDGAKPIGFIASTPLVSRTPKASHMMKTPTYSNMQKMQSPMKGDSSMFAGSPAYKSSNKLDESLEDMEFGNPDDLYDDADDAYDHSLTREAPRLASLYYKGLLESLAEKFKSPMRTPGRPGFMTQPSPMITAAKTPSRTPFRTPLHAQALRFQTRPGSKEITAATPTPLYNHYTPEGGDNYFEEDPHHLYGPKFANTWWREVLILTIRNFKNIQRTPELFMSRQMVLTVMGFMMATLFKRAKHNLDGVTELLSFFIFTVCLFFFSSNDAVPTFIQERFIYIRETSHNAYRASSYVVAGVITYLPFLAVQALTYTLITWWAIHLQDGSLFFFWLVLYVSLMCTSSFVMFISALVPNYILGYAAVIAFTALFFLTCGYFLKRGSIPKYWIWLHYLSTLKYPYEALLQNEFHNLNKQPCYAFDQHAQCALHGTDLLNQLDINQTTKYQNLGIILGWAVLYRVLFYFVLRFASKNQRA